LHWLKLHGHRWVLMYSWAFPHFGLPILTPVISR